MIDTRTESERFLNDLFVHIEMYEIANMPWWEVILPWGLKRAQRRAKRRFRAYVVMCMNYNDKQLN